MKRVRGRYFRRSMVVVMVMMMMMAGSAGSGAERTEAVWFDGTRFTTASSVETNDRKRSEEQWLCWILLPLKLGVS